MDEDSLVMKGGTVEDIIVHECEVTGVTVGVGSDVISKYLARILRTSLAE